MNTATRLTLYLGAFSAMALSNAVVPVLAGLTPDLAEQGLLYAAYFFGAFVMVFPVGWISDKTGRSPLIRTGLIGTFAVSILLFFVYPDIHLSILLRALEGIFTGIFGAAALSFVNSQKEHLKLSGAYLALLNIGMVAGLVVTGFLAALHPYAGVLLFGVLTGVAATASLFFQDENVTSSALSLKAAAAVAKYHVWLWVAVVMATGATGVITSTYPAMSALPADMAGVLTAIMSIATAAAVYLTSRAKIHDPLAVLRFAVICMAFTLPLVVLSPLGIILSGAAFGVVTAAAVDYIAKASHPQGVMNGLFLLVQYGGMGFLPVVAGFLTVPLGYLAEFLLLGILLAASGLFVVRCPCYLRRE